MKQKVSNSDFNRMFEMQRSAVQSNTKSAQKKMPQSERTQAEFAREYAGITAEIENRKPLFNDKARFNNTSFNKMFEMHKQINNISYKQLDEIEEPRANASSSCSYGNFYDNDEENINVVSSIPHADIAIYDNMKLKDMYTKEDFKKAKKIELPTSKNALSKAEAETKIKQYKNEQFSYPSSVQNDNNYNYNYKYNYKSDNEPDNEGSCANAAVHVSANGSANVSANGSHNNGHDESIEIIILKRKNAELRQYINTIEKNHEDELKKLYKIIKELQ